MKLRYAIYKNKVTSEEVRNYILNNNVPRGTTVPLGTVEIKKLLINEKKQLEYYDESFEQWFPVTEVEIFRN